MSSGGLIGVPTTLPNGFTLRRGYLFGPYALLTGLDLSNFDLSNLDLDGAYLTGVNLAGADLSATTLTHVRSGGVLGSPTSLPADYRLVGGYLLGPAVFLESATLSGADISGTNLSGADLYAADLTGANVTGVNFSDAQLTAVKLKSATSSGANFVGANMSEATLTDADVTNADLSSANLSRVTSGGISGSPSGLPSGFELRNGYLFGPAVRLDNANLSSLDLSHVNLAGALITHANLNGANLTGANLSGDSLIYSTFVGANLRDANLTGAELGQGATFGQADFTDTVWSNTTCVDGSLSTRHVAGSCVQPLDSTAPGSNVGQLPTFSAGTSIALTWNGIDGVGSGVKNFDVRYNRAPVGGGTVSAWTAWKTATPATGATLPPAPGFKYCFQTRARDNNNNVGAWSTSRCTNTPLDDRALVSSAGWTRETLASSYARTRSTTSKIGVTLTSARVTSHQLGIIATACKTCGKVDVFIGATKLGSISLYAPNSTAVKKTFLLPRFNTAKSGQVKIVTVAGPVVSAKSVQIDGLLTSAW
jgi:uncharacterized protein YjbI with pentapeptide repeats